MKNYITTILLLALGSCAKPLVTNNDRGNYRFDKRYYSSISEEPRIDDVIKVNVALLPLPELPKPAIVKAKTFFDLRDSIPHTFLKIIGEKADSIPQILNAIQADLSKVPVSRSIALNTVGAKVFRNDVKDEVKVRLLISSVGRYYYDENLLHSNTRIDQLSTNIELSGNDFVIKTIDRLENDLELIDLGTLDRKNEVTFSSDLKGEATAGIDFSQANNTLNNNSEGAGTRNSNSTSDAEGLSKGENTFASENKGETKITEERSVDISKKAGVTAAMKYQNSSTINEALKLQFQRIKTSFSFSENNLTVTQASAPNRHIAENVLVTLTLKGTPRISAQKDYLNANQLFKDGSGDINDLNKAGLEVVSLSYIPCDSWAIKLTTQSEGVIRSVKNQIRGRNRGEFDDKVIYMPFLTTEKTVDIASSNLEGCTRLYSVRMYFQDSDGTLNSYTVHFALQGDMGGSMLTLFHEDNVSDFREWFFKALKNPGQNLVWDSQIMLILQNEETGTNRMLTSRSLQDISGAAQFFQSLASIEVVPYSQTSASGIRPVASENP